MTAAEAAGIALWAAIIAAAWTYGTWPARRTRQDRRDHHNITHARKTRRTR